MRVPPLIRLVMELFTWRRLLFNRFTIMTVVIVVASVGVSAYVGANDDGHVQGQVVTSDGESVSNANVTLRDIPLQGVVKTSTTTTNSNGEFEFTEKNQLLEYRIIVSVDGEQVANKHYHLYFKGQNQNIQIVIN